ncbi:hypothetical protein [Gracilibacillus phocaeensis]|uniref:hypothetical protein n=1 Tax=Gracilibacillus phocaeensis TaxID=2042304 RepID=UPI001030897C|nr:hypothetical protein [Gracilibacillus phocaeensis]
MSKREIPHELRDKLDEFHVEVPDITQKDKWGRLANWIYAPAQNPVELCRIKGDSITRLTVMPLIVVLIVFFTPIFLF